MDEKLQNPNAAAPEFSDDLDSCCSTPFVSAPSSPGRDIPLGGFYFSAPSSPMHFVLSTASLKSYSSSAAATESSFEFDLPSSGAASADELFFNGQIRPMKLSTHLQRPQFLDPLIESDGGAEEDENQAQAFTRGRDVKLRAGSLRRRARSMSPLRNSGPTSFQWQHDENSNGNLIETVDDKNAYDLEEDSKGSNGTTPCASRSSSAGRNSNSKRWVFLKEFLYRSKSEGRNHESHKFWGSISFSPANKDKKPLQHPLSTRSKKKEQITSKSSTEELKKKALNKNGAGKRTSVPSPHEMHYTAKRAQAEEMRKRTFLPYRQGLLGCLGFSSKSYGAMNGFARALNPTVSSS